MIRTGRGASGTGLGPDAAEFAEIHSLQTELLAPKSRAALQPEEEALSLPPPELADPKMDLLGRALGSAVTTDNPVWRGNAVPQLRALQKALIAHSLTRERDDRRIGLDAVRVLERDIRLRLRWQQMARSDNEAGVAIQPEKEEEHAQEAGA
ncbi:hypothetical protein [Pseudoduganella chitinolytica]|uniref:Uncharacterized protein n=1 Tax=Pseudoduganella chitinolytica TaxID=34070 RepID=A0ABY8B8G2_9BURK|nr:hypothetical protein [Pseudoduganella chitinolytica]WEF32220.1 hypothetical protein PX653_22810 [Pseudoduganella chitinolytica]